MPARVLDLAYLLIVPMPIYVDANGRGWIDRLWLRDLARHLEYLPRLTLAAPAERGKPEHGDLVPFVLHEDGSLRWVPLPSIRSWRRFLVGLPHLCFALGRAVVRADIVHSGVAGWPVPLGWIANPLALLFRRKLVLVVESSFWRVTPGVRAAWRARLRAGFSERLARAFVSRASFSLFTHDAYARQLAGDARGTVHVEPAVWVDEQDLVPSDAAASDWATKSKAPRARFLFAGRLEAAKGVDLLLEALLQLEAQGTTVEVDFLGAGALQPEVLEVMRRCRNVRIRHFEPLPYDAAFFAFLRNYHALLVPNRSDEQPRIVFDAFSQAVTVLATRTPGLESCVDEGRTGVLVPRDDAASLAAALAKYTQDAGRLAEFALAARAFAAAHTHRGMHERRRDLLVAQFAPDSGSARRVPGNDVELTPALPQRRKTEDREPRAPLRRARDRDPSSAAYQREQERP